MLESPKGAVNTMTSPTLSLSYGKCVEMYAAFAATTMM